MGKFFRNINGNFKHRAANLAEKKRKDDKQKIRLIPRVLEKTEKNRLQTIWV